MSEFINMKAVAAAGPLKKAHYPFPRARELQDAVTSCMTDYYTKSGLGTAFEARGVLVTGKSRVGKTRELQRLIDRINDSNTIMPSGRPARIVNCTLSGRMTWKDLGMKTLMSLGYPAEGRRTQSYIWDMVLDQAERQGVIGIHYDECQHMFSDTGNATNRVVLDSFKALLKETRWPLILILSGVPDLAKHIENDHASEERKQLRYLLRPVRFEMINTDRDIEELNQLAYSYAEKVGICFDALSTVDFLERLSHACAYRWGLVIEMVVEAITICILAEHTVASTEHFSEAFSKINGIPPGFSPFTVDDYRESFDPDSLLTLLERET